MNTEILKTGALARKIRRGAKAPDGLLAARNARRPFDPLAYAAVLEILG